MNAGISSSSPLLSLLELTVKYVNLENFSSPVSNHISLSEPKWTLETFSYPEFIILFLAKSLIAKTSGLYFLSFWITMLGANEYSQASKGTCLAHLCSVSNTSG